MVGMEVVPVGVQMGGVIVRVGVVVDAHIEGDGVRVACLGGSYREVAVGVGVFEGRTDGCGLERVRVRVGVIVPGC